jgi:hypothetical protein
MPSRSRASSDASDRSKHSRKHKLASASANFATAKLIQAAQSYIAGPDGHDERSPLLQQDHHHHHHHRPHLPHIHSSHSHHSHAPKQPPQDPRPRAFVWAALTVLTIITLVLLLPLQTILPDALRVWTGTLPSDPLRAALVILDRAPIIVSSNFCPALLHDSTNSYLNYNRTVI